MPSASSLLAASCHNRDSMAASHMRSPSCAFPVAAEDVPSSFVTLSSPVRGVLLESFQCPARGSHDAPVEISSDDNSLPPVKIHPFFFPKDFVRAPVQTHEMRFHALARQQAVQQPVHVPSVPPFPINRTRQEGRLRRRVSTPPPVQPPAPILFSPPRLHGRTRRATPLCSEVVNLNTSTSPRVDRHLDPKKILFPDSPPVPSILNFAEGCQDSQVSRYYHSVGINCFLETLDKACQTSPRLGFSDADVQTSPRLQPLTLYDLHTELRAFLVGLGF